MYIFKNQQKLIITFIFLFFFLANHIIYWLHNKISAGNLEIHSLRELVHKNELDRESYVLINNKYEEIKIIQHDLLKYCTAIESLLTDRQIEAISVIKALKERTKESVVPCYTENKILNILIYEKSKLCNENNISFQCYFENISFEFINILDILAVFSNLLDNAIESCILSARKNIYLNTYLLNEAYYIIALENSADVEPKIISGELVTHKNNENNNHGLGMKSVSKAIKYYNGSMQWEYDEQNKSFKTTVMFNISKKQRKSTKNIR